MWKLYTIKTYLTNIYQKCQSKIRSYSKISIIRIEDTISYYFIFCNFSFLFFALVYLVGFLAIAVSVGFGGLDIFCY